MANENLCIEHVDIKSEPNDWDFGNETECYEDHEAKVELSEGPDDVQNSSDSPTLSKIPQQSNAKNSFLEFELPTISKEQAAQTVDSDNKYACFICEKRFPTSEQCSTHMRSHIDNLSCNDCDRTFTSKTVLATHVQTHTQSNLVKSTNKTVKLLNKDVNISKVDEKSIIGNILTVSKDIHMQLLSMNTGKSNLKQRKPHTCNICKKSYPLKSTLVTHLRIHSGERPYSCDICSKRFIQQSALLKHMLTHSGEKNFSCPICSRKFSQKSHLATHYGTHTDLRRFSCKDCDKLFTRKSDLKRHQLTHTHEKPFCCNICSKSFSTKPSLVTHLRVHTGERPYPCDLCDKRFKQTSSLAKHKLLHTGEKPFSCDICPRRFRQKVGLNNHVCRTF